MIGSRDDPAYQVPHVDSAASFKASPLVTFVAYLEVEKAIGGELVAYEMEGQNFKETGRYFPLVGSVVAMRGDQIHAVSPLLEGKRVSIVVNFYSPEL